MAYPTKNFFAIQGPFDLRLSAVKADFQALIPELAAGPVGASKILNTRRFSSMTSTAIAAHKAVVTGTTGMAAAVAADKGITAAALGNAIDAVRVAMDAVTTACATLLPADANGYLLIIKLNGGGTVDRAFSPAETAALRTALTAAVAEIA